MTGNCHLSHPCIITVIDACQYGRLGLQSILTSPTLSSFNTAVDIYEGVDTALTAVQNNIAMVRGCLILRLLSFPALALGQLLSLDSALMTQLGYQRLILLSPFAMNNVIRQVLISGDMRLPVRIINSRCSAALLHRIVLSQGTLLQEGLDELLPHMPALVLSVSERRVLSGTLQEIPIHLQARRQQRNHKTLYAQRQSALQKLRAANIPDLLRRFTVL
ncbi:hypothetical protein [Serratia marcescens]|uniref:hypothetical protein n=1 Tax=Serratia marcescens TaxID=615 RepID=UPI0011AB35F5|nr:hypothetical protein [Serratia marcescens]